MPKPLAIVLTALLSLFVAGGGLAATPASAHTPNVDASCDSLDVSLAKYNTDGVNHVKVVIDSSTVADEDFGSSYDDTFAAPDKTVAYHYQVVVTAHDDPNGTNGWTKTFSGDSTPCTDGGSNHVAVPVCHATNSDTNPYVFITPDDDSTKFKGHLAHRTSPNKTWKTDTVFQGVLYKAGSAKPDFIGDYTDDQGTLHKYDGTITKAFCNGQGTAPRNPSGDLSTDCVKNAGRVSTSDLSTGTYDAVDWRLVTGTAAAHDTVLATGSGTKDFAATDLADGTKVWLQYRLAQGGWVDEGSTATTGACAPPPGPTCDELRTDRTMFTYTVNGETYTYDGFIRFPSKMTSATVTVKDGVVVPEGCEIPFSLASYETDGPTWPTTGTQVFLGHDTDSITSDRSSITLTVPEPTCFGQSDLYTGTEKYDGVHNPVPHYPDARVPASSLIGSWNGTAGSCKPKAQVHKVTTPSGYEKDWKFTLTKPGGGTATLTTNASGDSNLVELTQTGTYTITEQGRTGWESSPWKIVKDGKEVESCTFTVSNLKADKDTVYGCTFYNRALGKLAVDKVTKPAGAADSFAFAVEGPGDKDWDFSLTDQAEPWQSGYVRAGTYHVTETRTAGWVLGSIDCGKALVDDGKAAGGSATVRVDPGKTVTCTFTNQKPELEKTADPATTDANPTTVPPSSTITYTVTVTNPGVQAITGSPVVDTLPANVSDPTNVTAVQGTWDSYSYDPTGNGTITWVVSLAGGETKVFRYTVTVDAGAPPGGQLVNKVTFENLEASTRHVVGVPVPTLDKFANPATTDASPTLVQPGSRIDYSVKVGNTGNVPITNAPVVDTLPSHVTVVAGSISDGGTLSGDGKTVTWAVTLAPAASKTLTYAVTVDQAAPQGAVLVNTAKFQNLTDTTTHVVPTGALSLVKGVSPVAGNGVVVKFGDTLTYTLTASATGQLDQTKVVVTDYLPGYDPERPESGRTTYVKGSADCVGSGTCTVIGPDKNGLVTWALGDMPAGSSRQVTFQVTIDRPTPAAGAGTLAVDILNAGAVESVETPRTPSNEVKTPVSEVLPVKIPNEQPAPLPHTGTTLPIGPTVGIALGLLGLGWLLLATAGRRREG